MNISKFSIALAAALMTLLMLAGIRAGFNGAVPAAHAAVATQHTV